MSDSRLEKVLQYHQQTKHKPGQYARSAGYMDWANQPLPYRLYEGTEKIHLPLKDASNSTSESLLFEASTQPPQPITIDSISVMLQHSLGLSAWKSYSGNEWALRVNPSSGNLHPTECYLLLPELGEKSTSSESYSVHYNPYIHSLEKRAVLSADTADFLNQSNGFALVLTSIAWREAWKYGERAYRYCQHDLGHALAALNIAANLSGWHIEVIDNVSNAKICALLGVEQTNTILSEREYVDCICWVSEVRPEPSKLKAIRQWINHFPPLVYPNVANKLSESYYDWPIIDEVFNTSHEKAFSFQSSNVETEYAKSQKEIELLNSLSSDLQTISAEEIILQRRSAQSFDRELSFLSLEHFLVQLQKTLPKQRVPFSVLPQSAQVHLVIFVHGVKNLDAGLYIWLRNDQHFTELKSSMSNQFQWQQPVQNQPLFCLKKGDYRRTAKALSCDQDIASDSAYSLGMLAKFEENLIINSKHSGVTNSHHDASQYPILFWETGLIGHVLYLAAESHGLRGTGIGCFFDDQVHELLGLKDLRWQSLYHFTVGKHIDDTRIASKPAYFHLQSNK